jgi:hypothetical protein
MCGWIWRHLPGGNRVRLAQLAVLAIAVGLLLWFVLYPWASTHLPVDQSGLG